MTETGDIDVRRWIWVLLPWVAVAVMASAVYFLPSADCSGGPTGDRTTFVAIAIAAVAILVGGAVLRVIQLAVGPIRPPAEHWFGLALCAALSVGAAVDHGLAAHFHIAGTGGTLFLLGVLLALGVYLGMAVGVVQKGADTVGVAVPISLLFVAGMLVAPMAELGYVVAEGGFC